MQNLNKIVYGHSLAIGSGAGRYTGGLVQSLAFGGSDGQGREYSHYAAHQVCLFSIRPGRYPSLARHRCVTNFTWLLLCIMPGLDGPCWHFLSKLTPPRPPCPVLPKETSASPFALSS